MGDGLEKASKERIQADLEVLAAFNSTPGEGITRVFFTPEELEGRRFLKRRMEQTGLNVREDAIGNIYGTLPGTQPALSPVWTGSHIDTVLQGGRFDGTAGVAGGLEALRLIRESGRTHPRTLELVAFASEEPTRFGMGCLGSRALAGALSREAISELADRDGIRLGELLRSLGYDPDAIDNVRRSSGDVYGFIEMHIEQGAVLEALGVHVGIVTTIAAPTEMAVTLIGSQGHAGATPMGMRHDALAAAAELVLELERLARAAKDSSTVGTVGIVTVHPGASNVIPGRVDLSIDIRSSDFEEKSSVVASLSRFIEEMAVRRGVKATTQTLCHDRPAAADSRIVELLEAICKDKGRPYHRMASGAYHDAMLVSRFAPFGMLFVPSRGGISHDRSEWTDVGDIADGADILAGALLSLAGEV